MDFDPDDGTLYMVASEGFVGSPDTPALYTVSTTTGEATKVADFTMDLDRR